MTAPEFDLRKPPSEAVRTESGLEYVIVTPSDGRPVEASDWIRVHYTGWERDSGEMFDTSVGGEPAVFPLEQLIPGMQEALSLCRVGEKMRVWIPEELAYKGAKGLPEGTLVFEFRVIDIVTPETPEFDRKDGAVDVGDGILVRVEQRGQGALEAGTDDIVAIDFTGWSVETRSMFHSSMQVGEPLVGEVGRMFPGFRSALLGARAGDVLTVWIPQKHGVDPQGRNLKGELLFQVVVHEVREAPKPIPAPDDVAAAPADAEVTRTGLASRVLIAGDGTLHPTARSLVRVHYTGWTTDGKMFDSSVVREEPAEFSLDQVIAGWTEGVQLMVEGETRRFWIPENLAYRGAAGAPAGMLVFDVSLLAILD